MRSVISHVKNNRRKALAWAIVGVIVVLAAFLLFIQLAGPASQQASQGHEHSAQQELWICPMHPQVRQDKPGKCPICGMDLVKASALQQQPKGKSDDSAFIPEGHAPVDLTFDRKQMIGLKLGTVEKGPVFQSIQAAGRIAFDPELYTAQTEYLEALRQHEAVKNSPVGEVRHSAQRMIQSAKLRLKLLGLSDRQIAELGASAGDGQGLLLPEQGQNVYVYAEVYQSDLPHLRSGLSAEISARFLGGETLAGKVISVDRVINPNTRTAKVRILVPNAKTQLRPESYVDVSILSPLGDQVTVPFNAVLDTGKEAWVFVRSDDGTLHPRLITIGGYAEDQVIVAKGLKGGETIVTSANFLIDSESRLRGALGAMNTHGEHATKKEPECPEGQFWHAEMKHCMAKPKK